LHEPKVASVDLQLAHVRDLRREPVPSEPPANLPQSGPIVASARITTPASPAARVTLPLPAPPPSVVSAPAYPSPASSGHSFPPRDSASGSYPYHSGSQGAYPLSAPASTRNWMLIAIVAAAAVLGSLVVWIAMRGGGGAQTVDAASVVAVPADAADEPIEIEVDAAPAVVPADAHVVVADAAAPVDQLTPDAAPPSPADELADFMARGRWGDAVALCTKKLAASAAATCTMAACAARSESKARQWFAKVGGTAAKRQVTQQCRANGIEVVPRPIVRPPPPRDAGVNPCIVNPADCQGP
jgi:hypothetical protein